MRTTTIQFKRGLIFRMDLKVYRVAFTLGKFMGLDSWRYSERTSGWVFTQGEIPRHVIANYEQYHAEGKIEILRELPAEISQ